MSLTARMFFLIALLWAGCTYADLTTVGSKTYPEAYIIAEAISQKLESLGSSARPLTVNRTFGLGGTGLVFEALKSQKIDLYPEYTGTIIMEILKEPGLRSIEDIRTKLSTMGLEMSDSLGFSNSYTLAVSRKYADRYHLRKISDLKKNLPRLKIAFSYEFAHRLDGYSSLKKFYHLPERHFQTMTHPLVYQSLLNGRVQLIDSYSTDGKLEKLDIIQLEDDLGFFPRYEAVILARREWVASHPEAWRGVRELEGKLSKQNLVHLNARLEEGVSAEALVERHFHFYKRGKSAGMAAKLKKATLEHIWLVSLSVGLSVLIGVPLGILAARVPRIAQAVLIFSGGLQTIPSLALLCFLIPWFGIGTRPALIALFLYGLLPIVLNTSLGIRSIHPEIIESARAFGASFFQQLRWIDLPLASSQILAGIRTATLVGIGTATLAALVGAGGYGTFIVSGLAINDLPTILLGAIPAAILSLVFHFVFDLLENWVIPRGIRPRAPTPS